MAHTFTVILPAGTNVSKELDKVRNGIAEAGGTFAFDSTTGNGRFSVKGVVGFIVLSGNTVKVTIEKKPFIVSNGFIEKSIRDYFA